MAEEGEAGQNSSSGAPTATPGAGADGLQVLARTLASSIEVTMAAAMEGFMDKLESRLGTGSGGSPVAASSGATPTPITDAGPTTVAAATKPSDANSVGKYTHTSSTPMDRVQEWNDHGSLTKLPINTE